MIHGMIHFVFFEVVFEYLLLSFSVGYARIFDRISIELFG